MKRIFALALTTLMLCGCELMLPTETTPPTTEPATTPTEPVMETEPPVTVFQPLETYALPYTDLRSATPMADNILLTVGEPAMLVKLRAQDLAQDASIRLPEDAAVLAVEKNGVCYQHKGVLVFLDTNLRECGRVTLPLSAVGTPLVSSDLQTVYYTTQNTIRSVSRTTGHDRPLRETNAANLNLVDLHYDGTTLECEATDSYGLVSTLFIHTATGELTRQDWDICSLSTYGDSWMATMDQNGYVQNLVSSDGVLIQVLNPSYEYTDMTYLGSRSGVVITASHEGYLSLDLCEIPSGFSQAMTTLNGVSEIRGLWDDATANCIWILGDQNCLYRWDLELTAVEDTVSCITPYYTRENPDEDGLAQLKEQILPLEEQYAIDLYLAEDALGIQPEGYTLVSEYRVPVLANGVNTLTHTLTQFQPDFLAQVAAASQDGRIHIALVQSITGSVEMDTPVNCSTAQFWNKDGNACIVLTIGDQLEESFYHSLTHIMDIQIRNSTNALDGWEAWNPPGFTYDYSYNLNQTREEGSQPDAFLDTFSMSFPMEDRACFFQYAMKADCADIFQSKVRQEKLAVLCAAIREAFDLPDAPLPWEQHLQNTP